jgi:hypothetical protein
MSVLHALMCAASVSAGPPDESHARADLEARALAMYAPPAAAPAGDGIDTPAELNAQVAPSLRAALCSRLIRFRCSPRCGPVPEQMWASCGADSDVAESRCRCGESRLRCGPVPVQLWVCGQRVCGRGCVLSLQKVRQQNAEKAHLARMRRLARKSGAKASTGRWR